MADDHQLILEKKFIDYIINNMDKFILPKVYNPYLVCYVNLIFIIMSSNTEHLKPLPIKHKY